MGQRFESRLINTIGGMDELPDHLNDRRAQSVISYRDPPFLGHGATPKEDDPCCPNVTGKRAERDRLFGALLGEFAVKLQGLTRSITDDPDHPGESRVERLARVQRVTDGSNSGNRGAHIGPDTGVTEKIGEPGSAGAGGRHGTRGLRVRRRGLHR